MYIIWRVDSTLQVPHALFHRRQYHSHGTSERQYHHHRMDRGPPLGAFNTIRNDKISLSTIVASQLFNISR
jgi:hypothetical protein